MYEQYYNQYPFPLSTFQKYAIEGIITGKHVLITAPTGSGKTLPADFAITHFTSLGKKVIYTTPIKALSNQKFYEFSQKYPDISFGILTGDIKINPQAQVLIMTAEILLNTLYSYDLTTTATTATTTATSHKHFQMDIATELACVIMDEVHYINDKERGHVWEETIMLLPSHIQMIMLSATLASPEKFARWCETRHQDNNIDEKALTKSVYLASETNRSVPLTHYSFITFTNSIFKKIKDKAIQQEIHATINRPFVIQSAKGEFNELHYFKMKKMLDYDPVRVKRQHVLNQVSKYMVEHDMLPALCFVLSRKSLEKCAHEVTTVLLEDDSKVPYIVRHECEQILRKLPNYKEYLELPEYNSMVQLLEKGIAIHHAGVMPILREMVELLYAKGYIKLLFATETFAIGLNMPTKTVVFTDCNKYDGTSSRTFYSHEYTQMAGRAGRRGIDTVGNVIHLNNLFKNADLCSYKTMLRGIPQTLVSKFKISYHIVLMNQQPDFIKHSMIHREINNELTQFIQTKHNVEKEIANYKNTISLLKTPQPIIQQYINYSRDVASCVNKKRKEYERSIKSIEEEYKTIKSDKTIVEHYNETIEKHNNVISQIDNLERNIRSEHDRILQILIRRGFIEYADTTTTTTTTNTRLTLKGQIASNLKEIPCISFTQVIDKLRTFSARELIAIFSCFTNIVVSDDCEYKSSKPLVHQSFLHEICEHIDEFQDMQDLTMHYDLLPYMEKWTSCENTEECKHLLQTLQQEKDICVGDFVKAVLKINNISAEFETVAEMMGDYHFLSLLKEIPGLTLKYIATNQSLYV
jgi:superfamily II RNA helicase